MYSSQILRFLVGYEKETEKTKEIEHEETNEPLINNPLFRFSKLATVPIHIKNYD